MFRPLFSPSHRNNGERCRWRGGAGRRGGRPQAGGQQGPPRFCPIDRLACTSTGLSSSPASSVSVFFLLLLFDSGSEMMTQDFCLCHSLTSRIQLDRASRSLTTVTQVLTHASWCVSNMSVLHTAVGHLEELHLKMGKASDAAQLLNV